MSVRGNTRLRVLRALARMDTAQPDEVAAATGLGRANVAQWFVRLRRDGAVEQIRRGTWRIADVGRAEIAKADA